MNAKLTARGVRFAVFAALFLFSRAGAEQFKVNRLQIIPDDEINVGVSAPAPNPGKPAEKVQEKMKLAIKCSN